MVEEYFALNAIIERVCGPAHIITVELMAGLHPPEFKTKIATALDMKKSWKENPDLVYSIVREATEARVIVEQADKLRRV